MSWFRGKCEIGISVIEFAARRLCEGFRNRFARLLGRLGTQDSFDYLWPLSFIIEYCIVYSCLNVNDSLQEWWFRKGTKFYCNNVFQYFIPNGMIQLLSNAVYSIIYRYCNINIYSFFVIISIRRSLRNTLREESSNVMRIKIFCHKNFKLQFWATKVSVSISIKTILWHIS